MRFGAERCPNMSAGAAHADRAHDEIAAARFGRPAGDKESECEELSKHRHLKDRRSSNAPIDDPAADL
jgi:hypothetical protein